jgi:hypothetical protein
MIKVKVKREHIRKGIAHDCHRCPVVLAIADAIPDSEPMLYEDMADGTRIDVCGRTIRAPHEVFDFMVDFDHGRKCDVAPFSFELPDLDDREWQEKCYHCEELFDPEELDDEGCCPECAKSSSAPLRPSSSRKPLSAPSGHLP